MKIAIFNKKLPEPDRASGCRRIFAILELLAQDHNIHFYHFGDSDSEKYRTPIEALGIRVFSCKNSIIEIPLYKNKYHLGIFEFYITAFWHLETYKKLQPWSTTVIDSVDVHYARLELAQKAGLETAEDPIKTKLEELATYKKVDTVCVITKDDQFLLADEGIDNTILVPNIVPSTERNFALEREPIALFVGGFSHPPNIDAVTWLIEEIWPLVTKKMPTAKLSIVGSQLPDDLAIRAGQLDGISVLGFVEDLSPTIESSAISVAPLRYGAGMKGKVNQAMASGMLVVSTSIGLQGITGQHNIHFLKADTSDSFANEIVNALSSPEMQANIGRNAQILSEQICGVPAAQKGLDSMTNLARDKSSVLNSTFSKTIFRNTTYAIRACAKLVRSAISR